MGEIARNLTTTIKFVYEGTPAPEPTPIHFDFDFDFSNFSFLSRFGLSPSSYGYGSSSTGDLILTCILLFLFLLLVGAGIYVLAKKRMHANGISENTKIARAFSLIDKYDKKIKIIFCALVVALSSVLLVNAMFGKQAVGVANADSFSSDVEEFNVYTPEELICHVKDDGKTKSFELDDTGYYIQNNEEWVTANFSYAIVESDFGPWDNVNWQIKCDGKEIYNQPANIPMKDNKAFSIDLKHGEKKSLSIQPVGDGATWDWAYSLCGLDALRVTYVATPNLMKSLGLPEGMTPENATGMLERSFADSPWDVKRATGVEFNLVEGDQTLDEYVAQYARKYQVYNEEQQKYEEVPYVVDLSEAQNKTILAIITDDPLTNSYKAQVISKSVIYANTDSLSYLFRNFNSLYHIDFDNLDFSFAQDASYMFSGTGRDDGAMMTLKLNANSKGDPLVFPKGLNANYMFAGCNASIDLSNVVFQDGTQMDYFFQDFGTGLIEDTTPPERTRPLQMTLSSDPRDPDKRFKIPTNSSSYRMFEGLSVDLTPEGVEYPNRPLDQIDTSNANNLIGMFANYCQNMDNVTLDLSHMDINTEGDDMTQMFEGCFAGGKNDTIIFPKDEKGKFKLAKNVTSMFQNCDMQELDMRDFDFSQVNNMSHFLDSFCRNQVFTFAPGESPIKWPEKTDFKTAENCDASYMYANTSMYPDVIGLWDPKNITSMKGFFSNYMRGLVGPIHQPEGADDPVTINLQKISGLEAGPYVFATGCDLSEMFKFAYCNVDMSEVDVSGVTNFANMFEMFGAVKAVNEGKAETVCTLKLGDEGDTNKFVPAANADFSHMFDLAQLSVIDLTNVDFSKVHKFSYMFSNVGQFISLDIKQPTDIAPTALSAISPFYCQVNFPETIAPYVDTVKGEGAQMDYMFSNFNWDAGLVNKEEGNNYYIDISGFDTSKVQNFEGMFSKFNSHPFSGIKPAGEDETDLSYRKNLVLPTAFSTYDNANMSHMFENSNAYTGIKTINSNGIYTHEVCLDVSGFDTSNVTNMSYMFSYMWLLPIGPISSDLQQITTSWQELVKLETYQFSLDLSKFDVSKVEDMSYMLSYTFYRHPGLSMAGLNTDFSGKLTLFNQAKPEFSLFGEGEVTCKAEHIFDGCGVPELDLRSTDFYNATDLTSAFAHLGFESSPCHILGLSDLKIGQNATGCKLVSLFDSSYLYFDEQGFEPGSVKLDLRGWDISKTTDLSYLFYRTQVDELDVSNWNPASCTNMEGMFQEFGNNYITYGGEEPKYQKSVVKFPDVNSKDKDGNQIYWTTGDECSMKHMFSMCLADVDLSYFKVDKVTNMEGMFLSFGTAEKQVVDLVKKYIEQLIGGKNGNNYSNFADLATGFVDQLFDMSSSELVADVAAANSLVDGYTEKTKTAFNFLDASSKVSVQDNNFGYNLDALNADSSANLSSILPNTGLTSAAYNNKFVGELNEDLSIQRAQLKTALVESLSESTEEDKLMEIFDSAVAGTNEAQPNFMLENCKVTFPQLGPNGEKTFNPATAKDTYRCSMKEMFALYNFFNIKDTKTLQDLVPNFSSFDTSKVTDMSYMFTGFLIQNPSNFMSITPDERIKFDISSFDTSKVESMKLMFAGTGFYYSDAINNTSSNDTPQSPFIANWILGDKFKIAMHKEYDEVLHTDVDVPCDVSFMFAFCCVNEVVGLDTIIGLPENGTTSTKTMFAFSDIINLDISKWEASKVTDLSYMFAFYGLASNLLDQFLIGGIAEHNIKIGTEGTEQPKFVLAKDANVVGMFAFPSVNEINLKNMDVSNATSFEKMFEFCISFKNIEDKFSEIKTKIDISTWNATSAINFKSMFAYSAFNELKLPEGDKKLQTGDSADMTGMFKYCLCTYEHKTELSNEKYYYEFDISHLDMSKASSTKQMFFGFNILLQVMGTQGGFNKSEIVLGAQTMNKCLDMSEMFELTPMGIDISGLSANSVVNLDKMFAFSGYHYIELVKKKNSERLNAVDPASFMEGFMKFKTTIKFPKADSTTESPIKPVQGATANFMFAGTNMGDLEQDPVKRDYDTWWDKAKEINIAFMDTSKVASMEGLFMLLVCPLDLTSLNISSATNMKFFFTGYGWLAMSFELQTVDPEKPEDPLIKIEIKITNLPEVKLPDKLTFNKDCSVDYMFTLYGAAMDTDDTGAQFYDLSMFDVSNLQNFDYMFAYSLGLFNFDISTWNLKNMKSLNHIFQGYGLLFNTIYDYLCVNEQALNSSLGITGIIPFIDSLMNTKPFMFPALPEGESTYSAVGMFEFAAVFTCKSEPYTPQVANPEPEPVTMYTLKLDKKFDISDWELNRINDASYMFAGYGISPYSLIYNGTYLISLLYGKVIEATDVLADMQEEFLLGKIQFPEIVLNKELNEEWNFAGGALLEGTFAFCDANVDITGLKFDNIKSTSHMFAGYAPSYDTRFENTRLKVDLLENKEDIEFPETGCEAKYMFAAYHPTTLDLTNMDVTNITDLSGMFALSFVKELNVSNWDTKNATSFMATFAGSQANIVDVSSWNFNSAKDISYMFAMFGSLTSSSFVRLPEVEEKSKTDKDCNASYMFYASNLDSIILRGFTNEVVDNLSNVDYMFNSSPKLKSINVRSDSDWRNRWLSGTYMFEGCTNLVGSNGTAYKDYHTNIDYAVYDNDKNHGYFTAAHELREPVELKEEPDAEDKDLSSIFLNNEDKRYKGFTLDALNAVEKVEFKNESRTPAATDIDLSIAQDKSILAYIDSDTKTLYVCANEPVYSEPKSFVNMFNWNKNEENAQSALASIEFGNEVVNAVSATSMYGTFANCPALNSELNVYKLNTANVKNMSHMFSNCGSESNHVSLIFNNAEYTFNTGSVKDMSYMFDNAYVYSGKDNGVENNLDLIKFSVNNVTDMKYMFNEYSGKPINFPTAYASFAPYRSCDYSNMFTNVNLKYLDLSGFLISAGSNVLEMFCYSKERAEENDTPLSAIYVAKDRDSATYWNYMTDVEPDRLDTVTFKNCNNLPKPSDSQTINKYVQCRPFYHDTTTGWDTGRFYNSVVLDEDGQEELGGFDKMLSEHNKKLSGKTGLSLNEIRIGDKTNFSDYSANNIIAYTQCEDKPISIYSALLSPNLYDTVIVSPENIEFQGNSFKNLIPRITTNGISPDISALTQVTSAILHVKRVDTYTTEATNPDVSGMFKGAKNLIKFDIKEVETDGDINSFYFRSENFESMFEGCESLRTINADLFETHYMNNTKNMFKDCKSLRTLETNYESKNWGGEGSKVTSSEEMFAGCTNLVGGTSFRYKDEGQAHNITFAKACPTSGDAKEGFFTYGAILRSTSTDLFDIDDVYTESLTDYIMTRYFGGAEVPEEELRLAYSTLGLNRKQLVRSVKFYKNFEKSDDYDDYELSSKYKKISIKQGWSSSDTEQGLYAYVYSGEYDNITIPVLNTKIPLYRIAISTCGNKYYDEESKKWITDEYDAPIIAQEDSLIKMFKGLKFLGYYNAHDDEEHDNSIDFFADRNEEYAQGTDYVLDISAVNDMTSMFEDSFSDSLGSNYQIDSDVNERQVLDLTGLDTSNVEVFDNMFKNCKARVLKLSTLTENSSNDDPQEEETKFSVANARSMNGMFSGFGRVDIVERDIPVKIGDAAPQIGIGLIDSPSVIKFPANFGSKFADCDGRNLFSFCHVINLDVSNVNFSNFRNMDNMFAYAGGFRLVTQLPNPEPEPEPEPGNYANYFGVVNNSEDFNYAVNLAKSLESCDANSTDMMLQSSFKAGKSISEFGNGFAGEITFPDIWGPGIDGATANGMFKGLMMKSSGTQNMDTSKVVSMNEMFANTTFTQYIYVGNNTASSTAWDTKNVESMEQMFAWCGRIDGTSLIGNYNAPAEGQEAKPDGKLHFKFMNGCNVAEMFKGAHIPVDLSLTTGTTGSAYGLDVIDDYYGMFADYALYALPTLKGIGLSEETPLIGTFGHPENMVITFIGEGSKATTWTPPAGSSMNEMFRNCKVPLDLSVLNTKNVVSYQYMFQDYGKRNEVDIAYKYGIDYAREQIKQKAPEYLELFDKYVKLLDGVEIYGTPEEEQPEGTFNLCLWPLPNVEFKKLDTTETTDVTMKGMFMGFYGDQLDLQADCFDTTNVVDMSEMFCGCKMEKIDLTGFNTKNVRDMSYMFESETLRPFKSWQIKLGENFTLDSVVDMSYMFGSLADENSELRQIVVPGKQNWTKYISDENAKGRIIFTDNMFLGSVKLVGSITAEDHDHVTIYNSDIVDYRYACIGHEEGEGSTKKFVHGYFTSDGTPVAIPENTITDEDNAVAEAPQTEEAANTEEVVVPETEKTAEEVTPPLSDKETAVELIHEVVKNDTLVLSVLFLIPSNISLITSLLSLFTWI